MATADSRTRSIICPTISRDNMEGERAGPVLPRRVNNRWPATIFAISRTAKVPGRIMLLIISIHTMKGIRGVGVPVGTK